MAVVPTLRPALVRPQNTAIRASAPPNAVSAFTESGLQTQRLGNAVAGTGRAISRIAEQQQKITDEAAVRAASAEATQGVTNLLYSPTGYISSKGINAVSGASGVQHAVDALVSGVGATLGNPQQRDLYQRATTPLLLATQRAVVEHASRENSRYNLEASSARVHTAFNQAYHSFLADPSPTNQLAQVGIHTGVLELEHQAALHGLTGPAAKQYVSEGLAPTYEAIATGLLGQGKLAAAQEFVKQHSVTLPPKFQAGFSRAIHYQTQRAQGLQAALEVQKEAPGDLLAQEGLLNQRFSKGLLEVGAHDLALSQLRAIQAAQASSDRQKTQQVYNEITNGIDSGTYHSTGDLPPDTLSWVMDHGNLKVVDALFAKKQNDPAQAEKSARVFSQLSDMAVTNPRGFLNETVDGAQVRAMFGQTQYEAIARMRRHILETGAPSQALVTAVRTAKSMKAVLINAGVAPGSSEYRDFMQRLSQELQAKAQNDKVFTQEDATKFALGLIGQHEVKSTFMFVPTHSTKRVLDMTPQQIQEPWELTEQERQNATTRLNAALVLLRKAGKTVPEGVTEAEIQQWVKLNAGVPASELAQ